MLVGMTAKTNDQADKEVWLRYVSGDDQALTKIVEKYNNRLIGFLTARKCVDPESTCQDVWRKVIEKRKSFDGQSFSGWVFTIARNMLFEQYRKSERRKESNLSPDYDVASDDDIVGLVRMEQQEMVQVIKQCMDSVGEPFITVFRMKIDGASAKSIADEIGAAENTVYTRVHRAKKMIQDCVEGKMS
jgi:RNA polymerase sigma-70 factor (ECF subfamily)